MDEVMFLRAYNNLRVLTDHIKDVEVKNAVLTIAAMLDGLNQRLNEYIEAQGDED